METIINYLKTAYSESALTALTIVYAILALGLLTSLVLSIISSVKKVKNKGEENLPKKEEEEKSSEPEEIKEEIINAPEEEAIKSAPKEEKEKTISAPEKKTEEKSAQTPKKEEKTELKAKWVIENEDGNYLAILVLDERALLRSLVYKSLSGVKSAIITITNNLAESNTAESVEKGGKFSFKVYSSSGKVLAEGEEKELLSDSLNDLSLAEECVKSANSQIEIINS